MKITMLGTSGSGKTVYMSAMSELFFNGSVNGYTIANRIDNFDNNTFVYKSFKNINTLYQYGEFPSGTTSSVVMPLELRYRGKSIIEIDWIDYRGGAIKELALGYDNPLNAEVLATLIASDVVMVFIDSAVLKICKNTITARAIVGANEISQLLSMIKHKKHIDIIFILSKIDSSIINIKDDFNMLVSKVEQIYSKFFTETYTRISDYPVIPVGALGYGNCKTLYNWSSEKEGRVLIIDQSIDNFENMNTINIASSFATALLKCFESEIKKLNTQASDLAIELNQLKEKFGPVKNLIDMLFHGSRTREHIYDLEHIILDSRSELMKLAPYKSQLEQIAAGVE